MDDESYFSMNGQKLPGHDGYYSSDRLNCNPEVKYESKDKFPVNVLFCSVLSSVRTILRVL